MVAISAAKAGQLWRLLFDCFPMGKLGGGYRGWYWHWVAARVNESGRRTKGLPIRAKSGTFTVAHPDGRRIDVTVPFVADKSGACVIESMCVALAEVWETTPDRVADFIGGS